MAAAARLGLLRGPLGGRLGALAFSSRSCGGSPAEAAVGARLTRAWQADGIRNVVLSNPRRRNALSLAMLKSLREDLLRDINSPDLRVIIISGEGPVFSSGHDLKELSHETGEKYHLEVFETCAELMTLLSKLPVPVIAKVNGLATAAGCQLVASCDIAVVSEESTFATPGVSIGLFCSTPAVPVGRSLPRKIHCPDCPAASSWILSYKVRLGEDLELTAVWCRASKFGFVVKHPLPEFSLQTF